MKDKNDQLGAILKLERKKIKDMRDKLNLELIEEKRIRDNLENNYMKLSE